MLLMDQKGQLDCAGCGTMMQNAAFQVIHGSFCRMARPIKNLCRSRRLPTYVCIGDIRVDAAVEEATGNDVLLSVRHRLPLGQQIEVAFQPMVPMVELTIPGVVHWIKADRDEFHAGIVLREAVPEDFQVRHPACERRDLRFPCEVFGQLEWPQQHRSVRATAINYSRSGICVQTKFKPEPGASFRFLWDNPTSHRVLGTVRWVLEDSGVFLAGCELNQGYGYALSGVQTGTRGQLLRHVPEIKIPV